MLDTTNPASRPEAPSPNSASRRFHDAATLIVIDRSGSTPKVLMGRRHSGNAHWPDQFVFPGGRIERSDRAMTAAGALDARAEQALAARVRSPSASRGRALALAAIRETFEETGLLIGTKDYGAPDSAPPGTWQAFREHGVFPDLEALHFIARAITPPRRKKRFDARFFAVDRTAVAGEVEGVVGDASELVELRWLTINQARKANLPTITRMILFELDERLKAGFGRMLPIPFFHHRNLNAVRDLL